MRKHLTFALAAGLAVYAGGAQAATAIFAGGCFWSVESNFDHVPGVTETVSGFIGGRTENPTYNEVTYGDTGHREAVLVTYDPEVVSYEQLLMTFWTTTDPTDSGGQFCDRGPSYYTGIFPTEEGQAEIAAASREQIAASTGYTIVTEIIEGQTFYPAEDYHQDFHINNPERYQAYRIGCGRDAVIQRLWGDMAFLGTDTNPYPE